MRRLKLYFNLFRYWQWIKNLIIFIPIILSNTYDLNLLIDTLGLFILFSIFVSGTYIFNDIKDYKEDQKHPKKRGRPIASGAISLKNAFLTSLVLTITSISFSFFYYGSKIAILFIYYLLLTLFYSFKLKYINVADGIIVSLLYFIRLYLGSEITKVELTFELSAYIILLSMIIVFLKKNSILNTPNYSNKIKELIILQNKSVQNIVLIKTLSVFLHLVLGWWAAKFIETSFDLLLIFLFIILHLLLIRNLINLSNEGLLEDLSKSIITNYKLVFKILILIIIFLMFYNV
tara:strand:- start:422 stop:1291 length:870 start_codon:yes stop_codon:yes gene_type:complete